jgi:peptide/nickel transport system permease protein
MTISAETLPLPTADVTAPTSRGRLLRELVRTPTTLVALVIVVVFVVCALFAPWIAPHSGSRVSLETRLLPPGWAKGGSWTYPLGTDSLGRDMLSRLIYGARTTMGIGVTVVLLAGTFGTAMGLVAGAAGGRMRAAIMWCTDAQLAFPGLLLILAVVTFLRPSIPVIVAVLSLYGWMIYTRMSNGLVQQLQDEDFVSAARMSGCSTRQIILWHFLPNCASALLTQAVLELARVMLAEASLSYLGLGVQPPQASWGLMVAENQTYFGTAWWTVIFPGVILAVLVLSLNIVANWLRLTTDPRHRQQQYVNAARRRSVTRRRKVA